MRDRINSAAFAVLGLAVAFFGGDARATEVASEIAAGGLSFAANVSIKIEQQDLLITPGRITITYTLRNEASTPQAIYVSFAHPDLDAGAIADGEIQVGPDAANFLQSATTVDGQPVALFGEQRAVALGLDVTAAVTAAGLPLFPAGDSITTPLEALQPDTRLDLLERGVLKDDGISMAPSWSVKTVAYWRQQFAPGQTIIIRHSYQPLVATAPLSDGALASYRKRACLTAQQEAAIAKLPREGGAPPSITTLTYATTPNADALGVVRRFRLIVEAVDPQMVVASCRDGLRQTGPMQHDWTATEYNPDEEIQLLFAR